MSIRQIMRREQTAFRIVSFSFAPARGTDYIISILVVYVFLKRRAVVVTFCTSINIYRHCFTPCLILEPHRGIEPLQPVYKTGHLPLMLVRLVFKMVAGAGIAPAL